MIASFRSKALERFWWKGQARRVNAKHVAKLTILLSAFESAIAPQDMDRPSFGFHALVGNQVGRYALLVDRNWRVTFGWDGVDAIDLDYEDYH